MRCAYDSYGGLDDAVVTITRCNLRPILCLPATLPLKAPIFTSPNTRLKTATPSFIPEHGILRAQTFKMMVSHNALSRNSVC